MIWELLKLLFDGKDRKEQREDAAKVVDRVIEKNQETFDALAEHDEGEVD